MLLQHDTKLIVANQELVYFERKRIPSIIGKLYRVISAGNTTQIFFTLVHVHLFKRLFYAGDFFGFHEAAPARRHSTPSDFIRGTWQITITVNRKMGYLRTRRSDPR